MAARQNWIDRAIGIVAPRVQLQRARARLALDGLRHYEGAGVGWRTGNWHRERSDGNRAMAPYAGKLRATARDLIRNNPYAEAAITTIVDHTIGWGLTAKPVKPNARALAAWKAWTSTTDCDADGIHDFAGLQKLVVRAVVESGEVFVRRRVRLPKDSLALPLQLQVLEADYLDSTKTGILLPNGGWIEDGIEYDAIGSRAAYWLFKEHPGNLIFGSAVGGSTVGYRDIGTSQRVPADSILHVFKSTRPGAHRGVSWFAPVMLLMKELDEYIDASLVKQKIAACLAVITSDVDGTGAPLGTADDSKNPGIDTLSPGAVLNVAAGRSVAVVQPPSVSEFGPFATGILRAIATGMHVTYEDMTGDFSQVNFSSARMARLKHWARVEDWRWRMLVPQFCDPVWGWAMEVAGIMGTPTAGAARWSAPPMPMIEPDKEGLAYQRLVRNGFMTLSDVIRERGYDPDEVLAEMAGDNAKLDTLKLVLDSDPRKMTVAGQMQIAITKNPQALIEEDGNDGGSGGTKSSDDVEMERLMADLSPAQRVRVLEFVRAGAVL